MNRRVLFALSFAAVAELAVAQKPAPPAARPTPPGKKQPAMPAPAPMLAQAPPNSALASSTTPATAPAESSGQPGHYAGVASCANSGCHGSTLPLKSTRVLQNEYYTWLNSDRHAGAYNVLFNERSARIARNMHLTKKAYQEAACLDCHSTNVPARMISGHIDPEDGVQCEACHGPAGGWRAEHTQAGWTHQQSVARGMTDLHVLSIRGSMCLSCHLGNDKKEVDHELIASGHPILAFELDNYSETMPAHWSPHKETHGLPAWAVGQAVEFRDSMSNLARHARGEKWPEFSDMSCFNCHHALNDASTSRQERGWPGRAGLPTWSPQHWAVLRMVVGRVAPSTRAQLDSAVAQVQSRVSRMNDRDGVAASAEEARRAIDAAIPKIAAVSWRDEDIRTMMRTLAADDGVTSYDVHSAEQTALSLQSLSAALTRNNPSLLKSRMTAAVDALFEEVRDRNRYDPSRFAQKLRDVRDTL